MNKDEMIEDIKTKINQDWAEYFIGLDKKRELKHVCPVLRNLMVKTFQYEIVNDISNEDHLKMNQIRKLLDRVLVVNQNLTRVLMEITGLDDIYPSYFETIDIEILEKCQDEVIDIFKNDMEFKFNDYDLVPYYKKIYDIMISMDLVKDSIYERMMEFIENGAYLGCIINKGTIGVDKSILIPTINEKNRLNEKSKRFRLAIEIRASELSKYYNKPLKKDSFVEL